MKPKKWEPLYLNWHVFLTDHVVDAWGQYLLSYRQFFAGISSHYERNKYFWWFVQFLIVILAVIPYGVKLGLKAGHLPWYWGLAIIVGCQFLNGLISYACQFWMNKDPWSHPFLDAVVNLTARFIWVIQTMTFFTLWFDYVLSLL